MILYPRGFFISRDDHELPASMGHYVRREIADLNFYSDIRTDTSIAFNEEHFVILHGHAWLFTKQKDIENHAEIAQALADTYANDGESALEESIKWLGGRYVLVVGKKNQKYTVYHDAHGMRSVYFDTESGLVSSHYQLIKEVSGAQPIEHNGTKQTPLWTHWDKTKTATIFALIPNHKYKEGGRNQERYYPTQNLGTTKFSEDQRIELIESLWKKQLDAYAHKHQIVMSMTGGLDSRVTVALAKEHLSQLTAFTYTHDSGTSGSSGSWRLDKEIVSEILEVVPVKHQILRYEDRGKLTAEQSDIADRNSLVLHGRWILTLYPQVFESASTLHLRSNTHETARAYYARRSDEDQLKKIARIVAGGVAASLNLNSDEKHVELEKAQTFLKDFGYSNQMHIEPLDLFYWEFRMGRWVSEVYNETDNSFETFTPFNMRGIVELALGFSYQQRLDGFLFKEIINRNIPVLNFFRVNSQENLYEINRKITLNGEKTNEKVIALNRDKAVISDFRNSSQEVKYRTTVSGVQGQELTGEFLSIPASALMTGNSSAATYDIDSHKKITLEYLNTYSRKVARGYMVFELTINGETIQNEDLVTHGEIQSVVVHNNTDRSIQLGFKVVALKNCASDSWERASRTWIKFCQNNQTIKPTGAGVIVERDGISSIFQPKEL